MPYPTTTNEDIKKNVIDQLYWDARLDASNVKVEVNDGEVILSGSVPNYTAFEAADEGAWSMSGVRKVRNRMSINYPPGIPVPSDEELQENIRNMLRWQPTLDVTDINIIVESGWVTMRGSVDAYWKKVRAEAVVLGLSGVLGVTNELAVVPTRKITDKEIAEDIEQAIDRRSTLFVEELIDIKVEKGDVTVTGNVPTMFAFRTVQRIIQNTPGVRSVTNKLALQ